VEKGAELGSNSNQRKRRFDEVVIATSKKKESHRNHEQRRRDKINEGITQLKELIEPFTDAKYDKATILSKAIDFIKNSQKTHRELEEKNEALLDENTQLKYRELGISGPTLCSDATGRLWSGGKELEKENKKLRMELARLRSEMLQLRNGDNRSDSTTNSTSSSSDSGCGSPQHQDHREVLKSKAHQQNTVEQIIMTSPDLLCGQPMPLEACTVRSLTRKHERRRSCGDCRVGSYQIPDMLLHGNV